MSKKITTYKGLRKREGKQVNAFFTEGKKSVKVRCNVVIRANGDLVLEPISSTEKKKMAACIVFDHFCVHPNWPDTDLWHCDLLTHCGPAGYTFKHKSKPVETVKVREITDRFHDIEVGKEYTCMCNCDGHVCKGPWMIVRTPNVMSGGYDSYYLAHNMTKGLDGGNDKAAKRFGYKHAWWLGDVGEEPQYKVELILPKSEETSEDTYQGIRIGVAQTVTLDVYEGDHKKPRVTLEGYWKLVKDSDDVYLLSHCPDLDGSEPCPGYCKAHGFKYSWWLGSSDSELNSYYRLVLPNKTEPEELPDVGAAVQVTPKDTLERIAVALERIAEAVEL